MEDLSTRLNELTDTSAYTYNEEIVKKILVDYKEQFVKKTGYDKAIEIDKRRHDVYVEYSKIMEIIDDEIEVNLDELKYTSEAIIDGYGNIAVYYNGDPYITLRLALKALKTHNNIVFFASKYLAMNTKIIETVNILAQKYEYAQRIASLEFKVYEGTIFYNQNFFNLLIYVGEKREYQSFKKRLGIPSIYSGYGYVDVYIDSKKFKNKILAMDDYAVRNYIHVNYFYDAEFKNIRKYLNKYELTETFVLFSENTDLVYKYINGMKAKKIYINQSPFDSEYKFDITEKDLIYEKDITLK